jgi:hypothetical protein
MSSLLFFRKKERKKRWGHFRNIRAQKTVGHFKNIRAQKTVGHFKNIRAQNIRARKYVVYFINYSLEMNKYVYFEPCAGFNDILCNITRCLEYCVQNKRILLVNGKKCTYKINFSDYFDMVSNENIIFDTEIIKKICSNTSYSIYPSELQDKMKDILGNKIRFHYGRTTTEFCYNTNNNYIIFELFDKEISEDIVVFTCRGGGNGYNLFKQLTFKKNILDICNERYNRLNKPYKHTLLLALPLYA